MPDLTTVYPPQEWHGPKAGEREEHHEPFLDCVIAVTCRHLRSGHANNTRRENELLNRSPQISSYVQYL